MSSQRGLINSLKSIIKLLEEEKEALVENDVDRIMEIVNQKSIQINELSKFKGMDIQNNKEAMDLVQEIDRLQELNLLLTNQALSYQTALLETISNSLSNFSNTYSSKGKYETRNDINIIDQSV